MRILKIFLWILEILMIFFTGICVILDPGITASSRDIMFFRLSIAMFFIILAAGIMIEIDPLRIKKTLPLVSSKSPGAHLLFAFMCIAFASFTVFFCFRMTSKDFQIAYLSQSSAGKDNEQSIAIETESPDNPREEAEYESAELKKETDSTEDGQTEPDSESEDGNNSDSIIVEEDNNTEDADPELIKDETYYYEDAEYTVNGLVVHIDSINLKRDIAQEGEGGYSVYVSYSVENLNSSDATFKFSMLDENCFEYDGAKAILAAQPGTSNKQVYEYSLKASEKSGPLTGHFHASSEDYSKTYYGVTYGPIDISKLYAGENISVDLSMRGFTGDTMEKMIVTFDIEL